MKPGLHRAALAVIAIAICVMLYSASDLFVALAEKFPLVDRIMFRAQRVIRTLSWRLTVAGYALAVAGAVLAGSRLVRRNRASDQPSMVAPVALAMLSLGVVLAFAGPQLPRSNPVVTLRPQVTYQTILGWGASSDWSDDVIRLVPRDVKEAILDEAVNDLGLNRLRYFTGTYTQPWERFNDDGNPEHINWSGFNTAWHDVKMEELFRPFKQRVEALGSPFDVYLSPDFTEVAGIPAWLVSNPAEYAEHAMALLLYLRERHGVTPQYFVIQNEPLNGSRHATPEFHRRVIEVLGPRLRALGLPTRIQFVDGISPQATWNYIDALQHDEHIWPFVGLLSYHLYGTADPYRTRIRDFGRTKGIPTAQTETLSADVRTLFDDLSIGNVSYWEAAFAFVWFGNRTDDPGHLYSVNDSMTSFTRHPDFWNFRQLMHYVRPGALRIEASSNDDTLRALAFQKDNRLTTVLLNEGPARAVQVQGLPAGQYGLSQSADGHPSQELGLRTIGTGGTIIIDIPNDATLTIYPYDGQNQPPLLTRWTASPRYLKRPGTTVTLSAEATDPELGAVFSYRWSVSRHPDRANVRLSSAQGSTTTASGLSIPGRYGFVVEASDGSATTTREVLVNVYEGNQPPAVVDVHNRYPSTVIAPVSETELRAFGFDLEDDPLTYRWTLLSQPAGASAVLATPDSASCKASNLRRPGQYMFRVDVSDRSHTVSDTLTVNVS